MRSFKDNQGREWLVALNVSQMKRVRASLGVDLVNVIAIDREGKVKSDLIDRIVGDPCLLVDILWTLVEGQAKERGVDDVGFGSSLAGDSIDAATKAFLDELVDFFPGAKRLFLAKAVSLAREYSGRMRDALEKALADPEFQRRAEELMSSSPASQGS